MDAPVGTTIKNSALSLIGLPSKYATGGVRISACVLASREPDEGMQVSIGRMLAEHARSLIAEKLQGRTPTGIVDARLAGSDEASCEDSSGQIRSAFVENERCYRLDLRVVADE